MQLADGMRMRSYAVPVLPARRRLKRVLPTVRVNDMHLHGAAS